MMVVCMAMVMAVMMTGATGQQQRADDVDDKAEHGYPDGGAELHLGRLEQAHHRLDANAQRDQAKNQRRGEATQVADLAGAKAVGAVIRMLACESVRGSGNAQRSGVGSHVKTIGQQRHGTGQVTRGYFTDHHHHGQDHHPERAFGVVVVAGAEKVVAVPVISGTHRALTWHNGGWLRAALRHLAPAPHRSGPAWPRARGRGPR
ncbi:hypothetical protein D3C73_778200 [compost metagenome]